MLSACHGLKTFGYKKNSDLPDRLTLHCRDLLKTSKLTPISVPAKIVSPCYSGSKIRLIA